MKKLSSVVSASLLTIALLVLPGCTQWNWIKEKLSCSSCGHHGSSESLISFGKDTMMTTNEFEKKLEMIYAAKPGVKEFIAQMSPDEQLKIYEQIAESFVAEQLILDYIKENEISKAPDYQQEVKQAHKALECDLAVRALQKDLTTQAQKMVDDMIKDDGKELRSFYEENRDKNPIFQQPPFVVKSAGVVAESFVALNEKEAKALAARAKSGNFSAIAKEAGKRLQSHHNITQQSNDLDAQLRAAILSLPAGTVEVVQDKQGKFIVVRVISKKDAEYANFADVQQYVQQVVMQEQMPKLYNEKMTALKAKCNVTVNKEQLQKYVTQKNDGTEVSATQAEDATPAPTAAV